MSEMLESMETERFVLRRWRDSDAERLYELASDSRIGPIAGWPAHTSVEHSRAVIRDVLSKNGVYAIESKKNGDVIGCAGFVDNSDIFKRSEDEIEIGYWLGVRYWGYKYMQEVITRLLEYAFMEKHYETVWCNYYNGNRRSKRCMEQCGFRYHHTEWDVPCKLMNEKRILHCACITREQWLLRDEEPETVVLYVHGKDGSAAEAEQYKPLFPRFEVVGLDYKTDTPWETGKEVADAIDAIRAQNKEVVIVANSIGAQYVMRADREEAIREAFFISPMVDMEDTIMRMMATAKISERELHDRQIIEMPFGQTLSWEYLTYVREHPIKWSVPTHILYGGLDHLTSIETMIIFAKVHRLALNILGEGRHWFHSNEEVSYLETWILVMKNKGC